MFIPGSPFPCGLYYNTSMIVIYDRNDSSQYYKTTITIVFTILARAKVELALARIVNPNWSVIYDRKFTIVKLL